MEYELVTERAMLPEHLRGSSVVVRATYGGMIESYAHTEPFFLGQVTFNFIPEMSYLWLSLIHISEPTRRVVI